MKYENILLIFTINLLERIHISKFLPFPHDILYKYGTITTSGMTLEKIWSIRIRDQTHVWNKSSLLFPFKFLENQRIYRSEIVWYNAYCNFKVFPQQNYENKFCSICFLQLPCRFQKWHKYSQLESMDLRQLQHIAFTFF